MPPEPKKPIEELLEASAKARRAEFGAEPTMPNPMRARLHDEIARLNREDRTESRRSWLAMFWPQLSIGAAVAAVLATASVLWLGHQSDSGSKSIQLAMRAPAETQPDAANQVATKTEAAPEKTFADGTVASGSLADNTTAAKAVETEAHEEISKGAGESTRLASRADEAAQESASARIASAENFANAPPLATNQKIGAANRQQQFSQTARGQALRSNSKLNQASNILDTFQVEQDGREIRVVDADGSTYTGQFEPVAQSTARRMLKERQAAAAPAPEAAKREGGAASTTNELFFRATGFNTSLKKRVVFEGNYIPLPAGEQKAPAAGKADDAGQVPARIVGKAKVPGEAPVEVDAVAR